MRDDKHPPIPISDLKKLLSIQESRLLVLLDELVDCKNHIDKLYKNIEYMQNKKLEL